MKALYQSSPRCRNHKRQRWKLNLQKMGISQPWPSNTPRKLLSELIIVIQGWREAVETMVDVQSDLRCTWVLAKKKTLTCRFFLFTIFPENIKFRYPFVSNTYNRHKLLHGNVSYISI